MRNKTLITSKNKNRLQKQLTKLFRNYFNNKDHLISLIEKNVEKIKIKHGWTFIGSHIIQKRPISFFGRFGLRLKFRPIVITR